MSDHLPTTVETIEKGIADGTHLGAQLCVWRGDELIADLGIGESQAGTPMTTEQMIVWFSMTKASVAVSVAKMWERGALDIELPVAHYVPEFGANGKQDVTLRHCLTHTGGFRDGDKVVATSEDPDEAWAETVAGISAVGLEEGWVPGRKAGYHLGCGMTMLAECIRRVDGRRFEQFVRDEVFVPLGMTDCWVGMPQEQADAYIAAGRAGVMHNTEHGSAIPLPLDVPKWMVHCIPGGGGRGPMNQLVRLYRMLANGGELEGARILDPVTVAAISARHRTDLLDQTFGAVMEWGLGFNIDSVSLGRHSSPRAYGHGGAMSSQAWADPDYGLAVAFQTNGMPGSDRHYARMHAVGNALYDDLGIHWAGPEGRDKPFPDVSSVKVSA